MNTAPVVARLLALVTSAVLGSTDDEVPDDDGSESTHWHVPRHDVVMTASASFAVLFAWLGFGLRAALRRAEQLLVGVEMSQPGSASSQRPRTGFFSQNSPGSIASDDDDPADDAPLLTRHTRSRARARRHSAKAVVYACRLALLLAESACFLAAFVALSLAVAFDHLHWFPGALLCCALLLFPFFARFPLQRKSVYTVTSAVTEDQRPVDAQGRPVALATPKERLSWLFQHRIRAARRFFRRRYRSNRILFASGVVIAVLGSFFWTGLTHGVCYDMNRPHAADSFASTSWSRSREGPSCDPDSQQPCLLYLTVPAAANSSLLAVMHCVPSAGMPIEQAVPMVAYDDASDSAVSQVQRGAAERLSMTHLEEPRWVFHFRLDNLAAASTYSLRGTCNADVAPLDQAREYVFQAPPAPSDGLRLAFGGNLDASPAGLAIGTALARAQPHAAVLTGGLAQASSLPSCYRRWDAWLRQWSSIGSDAGSGGRTLLIPLVTAIGAPEVPAGYGGAHRKQVPFYFHYLPMSHQPLPRRRSYHVHWFGRHVALVVLDSQHFSRYRGAQMRQVEAWVQTAHQQERRCIIFAYHHALWPAVGSGDLERVSLLGRKYLIPLFDQYNVTLAVEGYDHALKATHALRNGRRSVSGEGVRVIGDGAMCSAGQLDSYSGRKGRLQPGPEHDFALLARHYWLLDIAADGESAVARAYDTTGSQVGRDVRLVV